MGTTVVEIAARLKAADESELAAWERTLAADTRKGVRAALETARRRIDAEKAERDRVDGLYRFEEAMLAEGDSVVVGLDEVGRGAVAGPLAVGAVVLPRSPRIEGLDDSKKLSPQARQVIASAIEDVAVACAVFYVEPSDIDRDGMSVSLRRAFSGALAAVESEGVRADVVLVDGNPLHIDPREVNVVKGDAKCASIAAASILAKVHRDALMVSLAPRYPSYHLDVNKGYASPQHMEAIRHDGTSTVHRTSFCTSFMQERLF